MSLPGDSLDPDDRLTTLAVFQHECGVAADRGLTLDDLLGRIGAAIGSSPVEAASSDDAAAPARPNAGADDDMFERMLRQRCYREAALPLAALTGQITRSLADFLG